jgi:diguanylate cyclase (GGDEF)-like protein
MKSAPLILLCDHRGEGVAELAGALSAAGYRIQQSTRLRQTLDKLARLHPAVLIVDPLSSGGGVELEAIERARAQDPPTPVLVVANARDPLPAVLCARTLERGLWDLVHRGAPPEEFLMRIERLQAQAARLAEMDQLRHRAAHDDRTDLLRPHSFQERLKEHFSAAQRHGFDLALLLIDLDHFGLVNKQNDHTVGDFLIAQVGNAIRGALRTEDVAGRIGGDEFAVVLPYTSKVDASSVVQRLLEEIKKLSGWVPGARQEIATSASIGFETFNGKDLDTVQTLRLHSEEALRQAKLLGGNQGVYYRSLDSSRTPPL